MPIWKNAPPLKKRSTAERLFGMSLGMLLSIATVVFCLAAGFLMTRTEKSRGFRKPDAFLTPAKMASPGAPADRTPRAPSSMEFAPFGMPGGRRQLRGPASADLKQEAPPESGADSYASPPPADQPFSGFAAQAKAAAMKMIPTTGGIGGDGQTQSGGGASAPAAPARGRQAELGGQDGSVQEPAADQPEKPQYQTGIRHTHGGSTHTHDANGLSVGAATPHRHRYRTSINRQTVSSTKLMEGFNTRTSVDLYKLEQIGRAMHDKALETGQGMEITDDDAQRIAAEIGIRQGKSDKKPNANQYGY